jgi:DNA polymerase-3 subunit delta
MIIKSFEIKKINLNQNPLLLLYGKNEGHKSEVISDILKDKNKNDKYEEKEILDNLNNFLENLFTRSLFEDEKVIIIKRVSDKILKVVNQIIDKNLENIIIIFDAELLDKNSKLRKFFEKDAKTICIPFYPDNQQTLNKIVTSFLRKKNINISQIVINFIVSKSNGDRAILQNELDKIENLSLTKKKITTEDIAKITNLVENHSVLEIADNCLAKNKNKIIKIFNENNFKDEENILIIRTLLTKSKKILKLSNEYKKNKDLELTIKTSKPPIFWKDKEITKQQLLKWSPENIKKLIYEIHNIELIMKKNLNNSINVVSDFILDQSSN